MSEWSDFQPRKYEDEPKFLTWLRVQEQAVFMLDPEEETEEELWARNVAKHGLDEQVFLFADAIRARHMLEDEHGYYSASTVRMDVEDTSQSDWAESESYTGVQHIVSLGGTSDCGKPESECTNFNCKHTMFVASSEVEPRIRKEFRPPATDMSDRPTEDFFLGFGGLHYVMDGFNRYKKLNHECPECHMYTPKNEVTCQNCDKVIA